MTNEQLQELERRRLAEVAMGHNFQVPQPEDEEMAKFVQYRNNKRCNVLMNAILLIIFVVGTQNHRIMWSYLVQSKNIAVTWVYINFGIYSL